MPEAYKVNSGCVLSPPGSNPNKITMPVTTVNNAPTPVTSIVARQGSQSSWERETNPRYADIYFNSTQFNLLKNNVNTSKKVYVVYNAPSIAGDDLITNPTVVFNYP